MAENVTLSQLVKRSWIVVRNEGGDAELIVSYSVEDSKREFGRQRTRTIPLPPTRQAQLNMIDDLVWSTITALEGL